MPAALRRMSVPSYPPHRRSRLPCRRAVWPEWDVAYTRVEHHVDNVVDGAVAPGDHIWSVSESIPSVISRGSRLKVEPVGGQQHPVLLVESYNIVERRGYHAFARGGVIISLAFSLPPAFSLLLCTVRGRANTNVHSLPCGRNRPGRPVYLTPLKYLYRPVETHDHKSVAVISAIGYGGVSRQPRCLTACSSPGSFPVRRS